MNTNDFVELVQKNAARVRQYQLGHDGSDGKCDCIGLIIGAVRLGGDKWPWTHGSNYTARYLTCDLRADAPLKMGDLVFKARSEGESGYDLPAKYRAGGDLRDYYHVGVVTCEAPLVITHCTSVQGGIKRDVNRGKWKYSGQLKLISNANEGKGDEQKMSCNAQVYADNGEPVKVREHASQASTVKTKLAVGTSVILLDDAGEWARIQYASKTGQIESGYMMRKFLRVEDADGGTLYERVMRARQLLNEAKTKTDEADGELEKLAAELENQ